MIEKVRGESRFDIFIQVYLLGASGSCHVIDHSVMASSNIETLRSFELSEDETYDFRSSANSLLLADGGKKCETSFIKSTKRRGPRTLPCGTPLRTGLVLDNDCLTLTL